MKPADNYYKIELRLEAKNLRVVGVMTRLDPMAVVYIKHDGNPYWTEIGQTSPLRDKSNPMWGETFDISFYFGKYQHIRFEIYNSAKSQTNLVATAQTNLAHIVRQGAVSIELDATDNSGACGTLTIFAREISLSRELITLKMNATKVDKKDFFGRSDPFLLIYRCEDDGKWVQVYRSEVIKFTYNPDWKPFTLRAEDLCKGDPSRPIIIECYDYDSHKVNDFIGKCQTNYKSLSMGKFDLYLINPAKLKKKKYINSGVLHIDTLDIQHEFNFLDYITSGTELQFMVAIDFTESNGDIYSPNSLHFQDTHSPNEYLRCISAIGEILQIYNKQDTYSVYGFGGIPGWIGKTSSCFALNKNEANPYVRGIQGVIDIYRKAVKAITLSGPTYFQGVISKAISIARELRIPDSYLVLLILTDGDIHDHPATRSLIVEGSGLPMSIIIVGIGDEDFTNMNILDSDFKVLKDNCGTNALRDIGSHRSRRSLRGREVLLDLVLLLSLPHTRANGCTEGAVQESRFNLSIRRVVREVLLREAKSSHLREEDSQCVRVPGRDDEVVPDEALVVGTAYNLRLDLEHGLARLGLRCGRLKHDQIVVAIGKRLVIAGFPGLLEEFSPTE